jgi:hemolysin III
MSTARAHRLRAPAPGPDRTQPGLLYDTQRDRYYVKPVLRGWLHLVWFEASLVVGTLVIVAADGALAITAASIYAATVSGLFGVSALYHRTSYGERTSRALQRGDHSMIFLVIAGTATPAFLLAAPGPYGTACLVGLWTLTLAALGIHLAWMSAPERIVGGAFIALGVAAGLAVPPLWIERGVAPAVLMLAGGALYVVGAVAYHRRWPDPRPEVFGYHEVFHACVCAAATCQYVAIAVFLL